MNRTLIFSTTALLALAACGNSKSADEAAVDAETTNDVATETMTVENTTAGAAPAADTNTAAGYATASALSDMFEIESSKVAAEKSSSQAIKDYAQLMIKDHTATTAQMKAALQSAGLTVTPPTALDQRRQEMLAELRNTAEAEFDTRYLDQQTAAHQEALDLHRGYAESGDNPALKQLAGTIAPKVQMHLDMAKKLDEDGADDKAKGSNAKQ